MEQNQPEQRRAADRVFQQSLEQLEDILQEISTEEEDIPQLHTSNFTEVELDPDLTDIDLAALEDAVADIEQYLEEITKTK
ncbi:Asl0176 protein [Nostoc sp. DSM 114160]|jgi:ribosome-binding factor A